MLYILDSSKTEVLKEHISQKRLKRLKETKNFFMVLAPEKYYMTFHWLDGEQVTLVASHEHLIVITDSPSVTDTAKTLTAEMDDKADGIALLYEFFLELTADDIENLQLFEQQVSTLESDLLTGKERPSKEGVKEIVQLRMDLLSIKQYYVQMEFLTDEIAEADALFNYIDKKFDRLLEFVLHLQEYIEQVREAYQSQIDIEQNDLMKIFTVVTTIFFPLTLIVGWYGMNLKMPEFGWTYGYPIMIGFSLAIVVGLVILFKKKKWF